MESPLTPTTPPPPVVKPDPDRLIAMAEESDGGGFCLACGEEAYGIEPDARRYACDSCGERKVYGAEELIMMGFAG